MKQVIVQSFCDLCEGDEQVEATTEVTHNGRLLDVCARHERTVREAQRRLEALFEEGVPIEAPPPSRPRRHPQPSSRVASRLKTTVEWRTCREPNCIDGRTGETYIAPTRSALGQHCKQKHDKVLADYDWPTNLRA